MRKVLLPLLFVVAFGTAAADRIALVNPQPSVLRPTEVQEKNGLLAKFAGQVRVEGTLYVEWFGEKTKSAEYKLIPSAASSKRLPHFKGYRVTWIEPFDGPGALKSAVDEVTYKRVLGRNLAFNVTGSWWIEGYEVGVECDAPFAFARVRAATIPDPSVAFVERPETC
ncbi:MAG: hypothetical protein KF686_04785 [Ramlibacter sp.]|nr:hypothetical protein [Ramlibacter sp.]